MEWLNWEEAVDDSWEEKDLLPLRWATFLL